MHHRCIGVVDAVIKIESLRQFNLRHVFQPFKDQVWLNFTARNQPVTMISILQGEAIGCNRRPETQVIQRLQPFDYILNVFKNNHVQSLPDLWNQ